MSFDKKLGFCSNPQEIPEMSLKVLIDHPTKKYWPGQFIVGRVQCSVRVPGFIEVSIKLVGEEKTYPVKLRQNNRSTSCRGLQDNFLETKSTVLKSEYLNTGEYDFRFSLTLPKGIPSSFEGKYGHVKYLLRGRMFRQMKEQYEDSEEFKIFSPIDLNEVENVSMSPITYAEEPVPDTDIWSCVAVSSRMHVKLERNAFVLGDTIHAVVEKKRNLNVSEFKVNLVLRIIAKVTSQDREYFSTSELLASDHERIIDGRRKKFYLFALKVPDSISLPNFEICCFFRQTAVLEIVAVFQDKAKPDLKIEVELILGHISVHRHKHARNSAAKPYLQNSSLINPLPYSMNSKLPTHTPKSDINNLPTSMPKPCPPYPETDSPFVCENALPTKMPMLPKHFMNDVASHQDFPYAKEDSPQHLQTLLENPPYPSENRLPYPVEISCPYPTDKSKITGPYPTSTPPYPREDANTPAPPNNLPYAREVPQECNTPHPVESSCPYPTDKSKIPQPCPTSTPPYSREERNTLERNTPYPVVSSCPYPKENSPKTFVPPHPQGNNCPYPTVESPKTAPYPTINNPPYPIVESGSFRTPSSVFGREQLPYPVDQGDSRAPTTAYALSLPVSDLSGTSSTAPYPTEVPSRHSAVGFSAAMPMPMVHPASLQYSVGFDTPMSNENSRTTSVSPLQFQPSAPSILELPTPPVEAVELEDDLEFVDALEDHDLSTAEIPLIGTRTPSPPPTYEETISSIRIEKEKSKRRMLVAS